MTSYPPGSWSVVAQEKQKRMRYATIIADSSKVALATVFSLTSNELMDNAHLIAAAPELLEACEMVLNGDGEAYAIDFQQIRNAIAKAKGES